MKKASLERAQGLSIWTGRTMSITHVNDVTEDLGLGEGRTNQNFIAKDSASGERFFIRVGSDLPAYGVSRVKEQAAARAVEAAGIGARVIHTELPDVLVCAFIDGRSLTEVEVKAACDGKDAALLASLSATIRRLHATPIPAEIASAAPTEQTWAPPDLKRWLAYAREGGFRRLPLVEGADGLLPAVEAAAGPLSPAAFCHFDLLPSNVVCARGEGGAAPTVHIVDFEYCNVGQPLMDLAILAMGCGLSPTQERTLVSSYLQLDALSAQQALTFQCVKVLATLRETLWGVVAEVSGSSALSPEAACKYTDENYAKFIQAKAEFERAAAAAAAATAGQPATELTRGPVEVVDLKALSDRAYLDHFGVQKALSLAVATVAKERPANPLLAIAAAIRGQ
jgi:Ser/Thr protein kinase RdoA (MazF antagonist)